MQIPDTAIRQSLIEAFTNVVTWPVYDTVVPKDVSPNPSQYILLTTQSLQQKSTNKCGHLWNSQLVIDVVDQLPQGYVSRVAIDAQMNLIQSVIDLQPGDLSITGWKVYNTQVLDIHDMSLQTPTTTITRKLARYQWILGPSNG